MTSVTTFKNGVPDIAAGAGVVEYLALKNELAAAVQGVAVIPHGDPWQMKGSLSFTPTLITATLPPSPVMNWRVPSGKALLFTGGGVSSLAASIEYFRVCRRFFMFGNQQTAAPAAPAAPTTALLALTDGIGTSGAYSWKVAPLDTFGREGALSAASSPSLTLTGTNRGATITPAALGTGVIGYNIYRTLAGGATYYFVGTTLGAAAYLDALPDSSVNITLTPNATWATGDVAGETADGPVELIVEQGAVVAATPPATMVYTDPHGQKRAVAYTFPAATIGTRIQVPLYGNTAGFVPIGVIAGRANSWRGAFGADLRTRTPADYGAIAVSGANVAPASGCYIVWGQQVIGIGARSSDPVAGTIHHYEIKPTNPHGVLIPAGGEIVVEAGALAAGVAGVRDVALSGVLIPTTGT